ncbi:MAG TPA: response regulator [Gemmatimonadota bacterium]|nr:response regulator [Gemmatimonadota bacterium]
MSSEIQMRHDEVIRVLLVSTHDWFTSALQAVLEPEGFVFAHVRSARHAIRHVEQSEPDIVILSERLPDLDAAGLVRTLRAGGLPGSVPLLVYSPNFWNEEEQAKAVAAGAWDVIMEPLRPAIIVARLRRLLAIGRLIRATDNGAGIGDEAGLPDLVGLASSMQRIEATAHRNAVPLSCVVIGPSRPAVGSDLDRQRAAAAALCADNLRLSDLYGWIGDVDVGVVAYNTTAAGVISLVRRLNEQLTPEADYPMLNPLSAGVVEFHAGPEAHGADSLDRRARSVHGKQPPKIASLSRLAAAQAALREARAGGGGIRIGRPA